MINPNSDDVTQTPLPADGGPGQQAAPGTQSRLHETTRGISEAATTTWEQTKNRAGIVRERTEFYLRDNPVPTVLGALALGLAIGLAIRYSSSQEEKEVRLSDLSLSGMSLAPWWKSARRRYEEGAEAVKESVDRLRDIDVDRYTKPMRKRWHSWFD